MNQISPVDTGQPCGDPRAGRFYDLDGHPLSVANVQRRYEDTEYLGLARTTVTETCPPYRIAEVSTVCLGHCLTPQPGRHPTLFETMIRPLSSTTVDTALEDPCIQSDSHPEALADHAAIVRLLTLMFLDPLVTPVTPPTRDVATRNRCEG